VDRESPLSFTPRCRELSGRQFVLCSLVRAILTIACVDPSAAFL